MKTLTIGKATFIRPNAITNGTKGSAETAASLALLAGQIKEHFNNYKALRAIEVIVRGKWVCVLLSQTGLGKLTKVNQKRVMNILTSKKLVVSTVGKTGTVKSHPWKYYSTKGYFATGPRSGWTPGNNRGFRGGNLRVF